MIAKTAWILALVGLGAVLWQWAAHAQEILAFAQAWAGLIRAETGRFRAGGMPAS